MKTVIAASIIGLIGIILAAWGVSTLMHFAEFTQTVHGTVVRTDAEGVVVLFKEERTIRTNGASSTFAGVSEIRFPTSDRTQGLQPGNEVTGYCPPGRLAAGRLDRNFPTAIPWGCIITGSVLLLIALLTVINHRIRTKRQAALAV